ncbi:MAG: 3-deoxy-D-manno-octulosonic acid transferase [Alphaproteobacteria bacterium]|nr:3-deoxy-D-manno-octulosonic acid transferase [Alphaproteobacteria bacterium]MDE2337627.1 3-deoxy-D-manno-octulosonic acid transferase [Alphaproteobacteria bacterium]
MLMALYKNLTAASAPLLEVYLNRREKRGKEDPARKNERRGNPSKPREAGPLVWLHAASVGEAQSLLALVKKLLEDYPRLRIMVTTGTVTSAKLMADRLPQGAFHQYIPADHPKWVAGFLDHWKPDLALWSESEFWPNMLAGIKKRGIPAVLLNARMSEKSFRRWSFLRGTIGELLSVFSLCLAQNDAEAARLKALGAQNVRISGNLKYAAAALPCDEGKRAELEAAFSGRPRVLWASTHPGEEELALQLHTTLRKINTELLTIIVPRHPARGTEIASLAENLGLGAVRRSQRRLPRPQDDIYVADTLGELGLFYKLCPLCIMGGSFVAVGGHNIIEPAQFGCRVFYGPHMFNFKTVCHDFESRNAALPCADADALGAALERALDDPAAFDAMGAAAQAWTAGQAHVVDETLGALAPYLKNFALALDLKNLSPTSGEKSA